MVFGRAGGGALLPGPAKMSLGFDISMQPLWRKTGELQGRGQFSYGRGGILCELHKNLVVLCEIGFMQK